MHPHFGATRTFDPENSGLRFGSNRGGTVARTDESHPDKTRVALEGQNMKAIFFKGILALALVGTVGSATNAQDDWNQPTQIGSYQDILARAGYANRDDYPDTDFGPGRRTASTNTNPTTSPSRYYQDDVAPGPRPEDQRRQALDRPSVDSPVQSGPIQTYGRATSISEASCDGYLSGGDYGSRGGSNCNDCGSIGGCGCDSGYGFGGGQGRSDGWGSYGPGGVDGSCAGGEVFDAPVYRPGASWGRRGANAGQRNFVVGVSGLVFDRDYEDDVPLSYNPAGVNLRSTDADLGTMGGFQIDATTRSCSGNGYQAVFWTLLPGSTQRSLWGSYNTTRLTGLSQLIDPNTGQYVDAIYNAGNEHRIIRSSSLYNLELNVLRNGGQFQTPRCRTASYEFVMGFRWFQFDEDFSYRTYTPQAGFPARMDYDLDVNNMLLGAQIGGNTEVCLTNRIRMTAGTKLGIFNNHIESEQFITDTMTLSQIAFGPYAGTDYSFMDDKNDIAFLGELDLGLLYMITCNSRLNVGYRAIGVSGVALALDQIPSDFTYTPAIRDINSNGSLLLHGAYFGLEHSF